jgi:aromatic ring-opening dioxygenase catalytic subunit (LigB family)
VYDFAGFDRRYFEMTYLTPDAGALAARVAAAMPDSEQPVQTTIDGYFVGLSKRSLQTA